MMLGCESECSGVEVDVVPHEGGDEVVRVIVQRLQPESHRVLGLVGGGREVLRLQLLLQERVRRALENLNLKCIENLALRIKSFNITKERDLKTFRN